MLIQCQIQCRVLLYITIVYAFTATDKLCTRKTKLTFAKAKVSSCLMFIFRHTKFVQKNLSAAIYLYNGPYVAHAR